MADETKKKETRAPGQTVRSREVNPLVEMLAAAAGVEDVDEFADACAAAKNSEHAQAFARVPYGERILLLPQCLRSSGACKATERAFSYLCAGCGACDIPEIIAEAERLGYMGVYILKGGRAVVKLIEELDPGAVAGVACNYEGLIGIMECERRGVPVQFIPWNWKGSSNCWGVMYPNSARSSGIRLNCQAKPYNGMCV